jgi:thioester reductase-like protein
MTRHGYDDVILITGFPRLLCRELVGFWFEQHSRTLAYLLVPAEQLVAAQKALAELRVPNSSHVEVLEGSPSAIDLGLSGKEYGSLAAGLDRIFHCSSVSRPSLRHEQAEASNVAGAREMLELAAASTKLKSLLVLSSASVSGNHSGVFAEADLNVGQTFRNAAEETLARAEQSVRAAGDAVPYAVIRPTQIIGDSRSGETDDLGGPYPFIMLMMSTPQDIALPLPTRGDQLVDMVPVDYVARAVSHIGGNPAARGRTFQLSDPNALSVRAALALIAERAGKPPPTRHLPANLTKALLNAPGVHLLSKNQRAFFDMVLTPIRYDMKNTRSLLYDTDIRCPPFAAYVDAILDHLETRLPKRRTAKPNDTNDLEDPLA